jgi:ketosteroid isomerase-like protein
MNTTDDLDIRAVLDRWARATREGRQDDILSSHAANVVLYDVLPPLRYTSAAEYRAGWDAWQPDTQGEMLFELEDLTVHAGGEVGFAYGVLQCGGKVPNGKSFRDTVRATYCLVKSPAGWRIVHQHISKPVGG